MSFIGASLTLAFDVGFRQARNALSVPANGESTNQSTLVRHSRERTRAQRHSEGIGLSSGSLSRLGPQFTPPELPLNNTQVDGWFPRSKI